jgi:adenylate cyclase
VAATAFANLVDGSTPRTIPLATRLLIPWVWGCLLGAVCRAMPPLASAGGALAGGAVYLAVAALLFNRSFLCLPVVVPVFIQPIAAFVCGLAGRHVVAAQEQRTMRETAGLYLPPAVVSRLAESARDLGTDRREVHATCLITDAAEYTTLSESLPPDELGRFMTRYFETAFRPVREQGGLVMNLTGDSILAVWLATSPDPAPSPRACAAALDVAAGMRQTGGSNADARLPTRIGIHYGPLLLGSMGALDHFEYVPIGDTVNTAARLESLNKRLRTEVLVSAQALPTTPGFLTRRLGAFRFSGKRRAIEVLELLGRDGEIPPETRRACEWFEEGIARLAAAEWDRAASRFRDVLDARHDDGPAAFFLDLCANLARRNPTGWDGVVEVTKE